MNVTDDASPSPTDKSPSPPRHDKLAPYDEFVTAVRRACTHPGTQQALRRGLAKPVHEVPARTHAALLRDRDAHVPDQVRGEERRAYYAVAALIAARPRAERLADPTDDETGPTDADLTSADPPIGSPGSTTAHTEDTSRRRVPAQHSGPEQPPQPRPCWGTSLGASLGQAVARDASRAGGTESRLHLLVRQETDGLHRMLPAVLRLLGSAGVSADYGQLLYDVARWSYRREETATRWLEDYYRTRRRAASRD